jgi:ATP-binding cassette subfamily B protein
MTTSTVSAAPTSTLKYVWGVIRCQPGTYFGLTFARSVMMLTWLVPGLVMREFFNLVTQSAPVSLDLWGLVAILVISGVVQTGGLFSRFSLGSIFTRQSQSLLQSNMLKNVLQRPGASALPESAGEAVSRFREDTEAIPTFALFISDLISNGIFSLVALVILLSISPLILFASVLPMILIVIIARLAAGRVEHYRRLARQDSGAVTGFIAQIFDAVQAIQVNNAEARVASRFANYNERRRASALKDRVFTEVLDSLFRHSVNLGVGVVLLMASQALQSGRLTIGDLTLFVYYLDIVNRTVSSLGSYWAQYKQTGVAVTRMEHLLPEAPTGALLDPKPLQTEKRPQSLQVANDQSLKELTVTGLSYCFPGSTNGVEDIHLQIVPGSFTVITGQIGSGKTTLLRVLLGLLPRDAGEIRWNGEPVQDPASFFTPPRSAYTAQVPRLFSGTLRENMLLGVPLSEADLERAIHLAVFETDLQALEHGFDTLIGSRGVKLSGGQVQRTAAARMFARRPDLLVFDDLSSALDVKTEQTLWERILSTQNENGHAPACLAVSHRRAALQRADRILVLEAGRVVADGKLDDLLKTSSAMRNLWTSTAAKASRYRSKLISTYRQEPRTPLFSAV